MTIRSILTHSMTHRDKGMNVSFFILIHFFMILSK